MKADRRPDIQKALARPDPAIRAWLFYGPDEAGSRAAAAALCAKLGDPADPMSRTDIITAQLKEEPSRLADEAAAVSMFGGGKVITVDQIAGAGADHVRAAAEALFAAGAAGNPVLLMAGDLKPTQALVKLVSASKAGMAMRFFQPDARQAGADARELCAAAGLEPTRGAADALTQMLLASRAVAEQEIAKYALYLDASPETPQPLDEDVLDLLGAAFAEGNFAGVTDAVAGGAPAEAMREHARLLADGKFSVAQLRAVQRRFLQLVQIGGGMLARGQSAEAAVEAEGKRIFWKEKSGLVRQLKLWRAEEAERALDRLRQTEADLKSSGSADGDLIAAATLVALARHAARQARR